MLLKRGTAWPALLFLLSVWALTGVRGHAQAALLMEEPYGFYGAINPTGHNAVYFEHICAATPIRLRLCRPGELGAVISRYEGVNGYDWIAIPLVPYLYSVEEQGEIPTHVDREMVERLRNRYRETHFEELHLDRSGGSYVPEAWKQLIGAAYERRIYAFRFDTTRAQDEALIAKLNATPNRSHFAMLFRNCADFSRVILNNYFPHRFHRSIFPDAGVTTPKQVTYKLVRYARKHPEIQLTVFEIPQVPGYRAPSRKTKDIAESFSTTAYAVPLTLLNPYLFGGIFVDYIIRGRYHLIPKHPEVVDSTDLEALTLPAERAPAEQAAAAGVDAVMAVSSATASQQTAMGTDTGQKGHTSGDE
ncbi:MAG: hypothetical protein ACLGPM_04765 [Acidobacteriota bacterium]